MIKYNNWCNDMKFLISGRWSIAKSIRHIKIKFPIKHAIIERIKLFSRKGRWINFLVAPTSCIVLMINRFEYIVSRILLLININAIKKKKAEIIKLVEGPNKICQEHGKQDRVTMPDIKANLKTVDFVF